MTEEQIARKLAQIATASAKELVGWAWGREIEGREPFEGEQAAILARAKQLNITLEGTATWLDQ